MNRIILASASPRRKEILEKTGFPFDIIVSGCDENTNETDPEKLVKELSRLKAMDIACKNAGKIVVGADTVVSHKNMIMGKPKDETDAKNMIRSFAGDTHQVFTGVCIAADTNPEKDEYIKNRLCKEWQGLEILREKERLIISFSVKTDVIVSEMSEFEIEEYVKTGEPMDKAGAYAIQGRFAPYIISIEGDYYNVVGLPICPVYMCLKALLKI